MTRKLLVVDDQDSITKIVSKIAGDLGYEVRRVNDPSVAFEAFEDFEPDVLIIDLVMPEVDGIDILHTILAAGTSAKIIVMSGFGKSYLQLGEAVAMFHDHPPITTLAKPFRKADLAALLGAEIVTEK
jgi:CheY-like chemotaxis protein